MMVPPSVRIFVCTEPTDMRKGFDGLAGLVTTSICEDVFAGHLFVFWNRRQTHVKVLWWDRSGFALWYKRLERGVFRFPTSGKGPAEIEAADLALLLEGIDLAGVRRQPRYSRHVERA